MLVEMQNVRQIEGEGFRRWLTDENFDLILWYSEGQILGFQLCYDKKTQEKALTWRAPSSYSHSVVDSGEVPNTIKQSPMLTDGGRFDKERILAEFLAAAGPDIEPHIIKLVQTELEAYPED